MVLTLSSGGCFAPEEQPTHACLRTHLRRVECLTVSSHPASSHTTSGTWAAQPRDCFSSGRVVSEAERSGVTTVGQMRSFVRG